MKRRTFLKLTSALPVTCGDLAKQYDIEQRQLDPDSKYMVILRPMPDYVIPDERHIHEELISYVKDCFEAAGIERAHIGVLLLDGFDMEIVQVIDESI